MRLKKRHYALILLLVLLLVFFLGPKPDYPPIYSKVIPNRTPLTEIENKVLQHEAAVPKLKPNNQSRIVWADDTLLEPTEYAIVFLHGFSASPVAGDPVVLNLASRYGCNLYLPRLTGHGIDSEESFLNLTPDALVRSAAEALAIGKIIGRKNIVVASSTGATLAAYLAAHNPEYVHAMLLFSPNFELADPMSNLLLWPWGLQMARAIIGDHRHIPQWKNTPAEQYWTTTYRTEGVLALKYLLHETMTEETFNQIKQPTLLGYYYENDTAKDQTISIPAIEEAYTQLRTPNEQKRMEAFAEPGGHVMLSHLQTPSTEQVEDRCQAFLEEVLGMKPVFEAAW